MESPKVINKVLLSSVAFGVSFGIGMLVSKADMKNALTTGALAATAGFAGTLVSERKKADGENLVEDSLPTQDGLHQSIAEATMRMQEVEAGINSLQTEHAQLLENISDLNSQKQQLETQKEAIETSIAVRQTELEQIGDRFTQAQQQQEELDAYLAKLESRKQELETENDNLQAQIQQLEQQHAQLAQIIASLEEESAELEAFEDGSNEELEQLVGSASEEQLEELKDLDEPSETSGNELTVTEAESDNSVGEVEEVFLEELDNLSEEEAVSIAVELTDEESMPLENSVDEMEEIAAEAEISSEELDSLDQEEINCLTELESTARDSEPLDRLFDEHPLADDEPAIEESAQAESSTEDFLAGEELIDNTEGISFETTEQSSWAELDNFEQEDATIAFTTSESMAEESEELDNLFDSTTTLDSEPSENLTDETAELGILDLVGELAQPESVESTIEESVTLEGLMSEAEVSSSQETQEAQTDLTDELNEHFFSSINEATEGESTDTEQTSKQLDDLISSSYASEPSELEPAHAESEFLENSSDPEENFLENLENVEQLAETEMHEGSTIDRFLGETLDLEDSFDRWEETGEEFGQLEDLSTSMTESSIREELDNVGEKLSELDSISEASLEEFKDLFESIEDRDTSISFGDDDDDIETTKIQNLWD